MKQTRDRLSVAASASVLLMAMLLAGCRSGDSGMMPAAKVAEPAPGPATVSRDALVGRWGIASFHTDKDRKRTEAEARAQCSQPYTIARGSGDGVMMHVADDPKLYELRLKGGPGGKTYLGFEAPAGDPQDRELLSVTPNLLTMRFVDADANRRYGTFIYARCG